MQLRGEHPKMLAKIAHFDLLEGRHIDDITINPLTPMSDQEKISPYNIKQTSYENKEKYQLEDNKLIQY